MRLRSDFDLFLSLLLSYGEGKSKWNPNQNYLCTKWWNFILALIAYRTKSQVHVKIMHVTKSEVHGIWGKTRCKTGYGVPFRKIRTSFKCKLEYRVKDVERLVNLDNTVVLLLVPQTWGSLRLKVEVQMQH